LALTFSTLLSSQVSGAHRARLFGAPAWGNDPRYEVWEAESNLLISGSHFLSTHGRWRPSGIRCDSASTPIRKSRRPVGSSGSAATDQPILSVPHPA